VLKLSRLDPLPMPEGTSAVDPKLGPPVTGDHDMFNIQGLNNRALPNLRTQVTPDGGTIQVFEFKDDRGHVLWQVRIPPKPTILRVTDFDGQTGLLVEIVDSLGNLSVHTYEPNPDVWLENLVDMPGRAKWDTPPLPAGSGEALAGGMGIMHDAHLNWDPVTDQDKHVYGSIVHEYDRGRDLLIRFQSGKPPTLVHSDAPVISGLLEAPRRNPIIEALTGHEPAAGSPHQRPETGLVAGVDRLATQYEPPSRS
jgi:hypothetical protein